jgi:hypothetical protein
VTTFPSYTKSRIDWKIALPVAWIAFCLLWFIVSNGTCPLTVNPRSLQPISYSAVLDTHKSSWLRWNSPFVVCGAFHLVGLILIIATRNWKVFLLMLPLEFIAALSLIGASFGCGDGITLKHVDTVEFDGRTYHLAVGDEVMGDFLLPVSFLFECNADQTDCHSHEVEDYFGEVSLTVNMSLHQLQIHREGELIFVLDPRTHPNTLPK